MKAGMSKFFSAGAVVCGCALSAVATPWLDADSVSYSQDPATRLVTVSYVLGGENSTEPAIITVDFQTNSTGTAEGPWVSIGAKNFRNLAGDVNKVVEPGTEARKIYWRPQKTWPNHQVAEGQFKAVVKAWAKTCPPDYMVVDLTSKDKRFYTCEDALPGGIESDDYRMDLLVMRKIPAAGVTWRMGAPSVETGRSGDNELAMLVTLSDDYYCGVFPVTAGQDLRVRGYDVPAIRTKAERCRAVTDVCYNRIRYGEDNYQGATWPSADDTVAVTGSHILGFRNYTGLPTLDLLTSAEWEFACRAGEGAPLYTGESVSQKWSDNKKNVQDTALDPIAWYAYDSADYPERVGMKKPNRWGIYDMLGGLYEWCLDWYESPRSPDTDYTKGPETASGKRVCRGAAWNCPPAYHRAAYIGGIAPNNPYASSHIMGFRLKCSAVIP